jgi:predicted DNA-binding protein
MPTKKVSQKYKGQVIFSIRIPAPLDNRLRHHLVDRIPRVTKTDFISEAISEKLDQENAPLS